MFICLLDGLKNDFGGRWSDFSRCWTAKRNNFLHPVQRKKRLGWSSLSDDLCMRMALRNHIWRSEHLKMLLCWSRLIVVSWSRKTISKFFLHSGHSKRRFGRSRGSDVLSGDVSWCRKPMRTHFLHPGHLKKLLGRSCLGDVGEWPWYLIIWLSDALKNDFGEVV
jgi:hypothetical protein